MNETYELNDRAYIEPTVSRDEQLNFVNNLRATQQADLSKINRDTHALGANVPMNLGGLGGAEGVFNRRYVAPQTNALVSELKAKAQASALNTALTNLQNQYQNEYQQAYRRAAKRAKTTGGGDGGGTSPYDEFLSKYLNGFINSDQYKQYTTNQLNKDVNKNTNQSSTGGGEKKNNFFEDVHDWMLSLFGY